MTGFRDEVVSSFKALRDRIVEGLSALEGRPFERKEWARPEGGGGEMSLVRGELFEKGGCNFSAVWGDRYPGVPATGAQGEGKVGAGADAERARVDASIGIRPPGAAELSGKPFFATGVSLVVHPRSPYVPVVHLNVRYLEIGGGEVAWFGGGMDLTPCRPFVEDTAHFHGTLRTALARHGPDHYARMSAWAKEYFFIAHRHSERGVGGVFFDYLRSGDRARDFALARDVGDAFLPAYAPLVERRREAPWTEEERAAQLLWRGRYVEFNLVYDRGTIFGLKSGGNVEAIFMSLPPLVAW